MKGLVSEIQKSSTHDGPGFRTVVFLKGCNMRCAWCHNPETVYGGQEILLSMDKCIGCGQCDTGCFAGARVRCGRYMDVDQIFEVIKEDEPYYGNSGGLTISGGEPLCQSRFVIELLNKCREHGIHTALETNLNMSADVVLDVCENANIIMCDIKAYNQRIHRKYTGVSNECILENLYEIDKLNIPILTRTPVIRGVNSDKKQIEDIAKYLMKMENLLGYELLSYHPLGLSKPKTSHFIPQEFEKLDKDSMQKLAVAAKETGIKVFVDNILVR